ncbi:hypothetical protein [Geomonas subterranea]|uniref:hypothetical protein n=1 Tax=Geomonas subterranea TaxID=2847989 RepID=UPI001CD5236C|nr:hypothetical protein [Geomonas fuzhouensis]
MNSSPFYDMQSQAVAFVQAQRGNIYCTARKINPRVSNQDFDDLVHEGYAIALELIAEGGLGHLKEVFWAKLHRSVWSNFDYLVDYVDLNDDENPVARTATANDPLQHVIEEERFVSTVSSVLDFLTPAEKRVLFVLLGLTARGGCVEEEASRHLGMNRSTLRVLRNRIIRKISEASRHVDSEGALVLSRGKPRRPPIPNRPPLPISQHTPRYH